MSRPQLRTRIHTSTRVMTRTQLCADTAHRFFRISEEFGNDESFWHERIDIAIKTQFVRRFLIVAHGPGGEDDVTGGITLEFDWTRHEAICVSMGDDVDASDLGEGQTFETIQKALDAAAEYMRGLRRLGRLHSISTWITYADAALDEYGADRVKEVLDMQTSPEQVERNRDRFAPIRRVMDESAWHAATPGDLKESTLKGFMRRS